jgi:hypothetical protein
VEAMPAVLQQVPDAAFLFMGHGPMTDWLRARMSELGVLDQARFRRFSEMSCRPPSPPPRWRYRYRRRTPAVPRRCSRPWLRDCRWCCPMSPASASLSIRERAPRSSRCATAATAAAIVRLLQDPAP